MTKNQHKVTKLFITGKTTTEEITRTLVQSKSDSVVKFIIGEKINLPPGEISKMAFIRDCIVDASACVNLDGNTLLLYLAIANRNRSLMDDMSITFKLPEDISLNETERLYKKIAENVEGMTVNGLRRLFKSNKTISKSKLLKQQFVNFEPDLQKPKVSASKNSRTVIPVHKIDVTSVSTGGLFSFESSEPGKPVKKADVTPGSTEGQTSEAKRKRGRPRKSEEISSGSKVQLQSSEKLTDLDQALGTNPDDQNGQTLNGNNGNANNNQTQPQVTTPVSESESKDDIAGNTI
jgi:hypothetical protein